MKRQLLELGGKGAGLVLHDADLAKAVGAIQSVWSFHSGQICTAPTRAIVHRSRYDELVGALAAIAPNLKVGDPTAMDTLVGPVISAAQRGRIEVTSKLAPMRAQKSSLMAVGPCIWNAASTLLQH